MKTVLYRIPRDEAKKLVNWGVFPYLNLNRWKSEMEASASLLPKLNEFDESQSVEVWFLTGRCFYYQSIFCAWTLSLHARREIIVNVVDDGTLSSRHEECIRRLFPKGETIWKDEVISKVDALLPTTEFPFLRARWKDYVNIRKLTDIHLGRKGPKLVLDSDMLFFDRPDELIRWFDESVTGSGAAGDVCLMHDCAPSYGYSHELLEELAGVNIPAEMNVGICGMRSEQIDWRMVEEWCSRLFEKEGTSYYLEQALVAMIAAREGVTIMPRERYITFPTDEQVVQRTGVLQHYVADSKISYFQRAWKRPLA